MFEYRSDVLMSTLGSLLSFKVTGAEAFDLPLSDVTNCVCTKNEVALEFQPADDDAKDANVDCLVEMRLYVPGQFSKDGADLVSEENEEVTKTAAEVFVFCFRFGVCL